MNTILLYLLLGFLAFTDATLVLDQLHLKVLTTSGTLIGKSVTRLNTQVREFLGVPYAEPPIGELRFRAPVDFQDNSTIREVKNYGASCMQPEHLKSVISPLLNVKSNFSEDCLFLNIYVPVDEQIGSALPIIVFLSGEGFDYSDPQQFDGSYLAVQGKVIVVTVNYRLSAFGFLSAMTAEAPGNVGLLDQRMALKWIKQNINNFGGDASLITLSGRFTGAMSAAIHAFSPLSKREQLFSKIILQSGIPVGDWVFDRNPLQITMSLAQELECNFTNISETIKCLRQKSANALLSKAINLRQRFRPIFDQELIIETSSVNKSNFAPVDVIIGMTEDEGSICTIALKAVNSPFYEKMVSNKLSKSDVNELIQENLKDFYKKDDKLSVKLTAHKYQITSSKRSIRESFVKFCGDLYIKSHSLKIAQELIKNGQNVYLYNFMYRPSFSVSPSFIGAAHGDDVLFTLGLPMAIPAISEEESRLTHQMVKFISNFAKTGDPNPIEGNKEWLKFPRIMTFPYENHVIGEELTATDNDAIEFFQELIPAVQGHRCE